MIFLTLGAPHSFFWCGFLFSDKDFYRYRYKMCKKVSPIKSKYHYLTLFEFNKHRPNLLLFFIKQKA